MVSVVLLGVSLCVMGASCRRPISMATALRKAQAGDVESQFYVGNVSLWQGDYTNALHWLGVAAAAKHPGALQTLGIMYERGFAVSQDLSRALELYRESASLDYPRAMKCLGTMYSMGWGCEKDEVEAVTWYKKAAERGDAAAFDCLGWAYLNGLGVPKDPSQGLHWLRKGAAAGNPSSQANLCYAYIRGIGVQTNYPEAKAWAEKSAAQGYPLGLMNLGDIYRHGLGVEADFHKAREYYQRTITNDTIGLARGADRGALAGAYVGLGDMLRLGQDVATNAAAAVEMYRRGAALQDAQAEFRLGAVYLFGVGVPQDKKQAVEWCSRAAAHGSEAAQRVLRELGEHVASKGPSSEGTTVEDSGGHNNGTEPIR
jgi:TPR repeat protein